MSRLNSTHFKEVEIGVLLRRLQMLYAPGETFPVLTAVKRGGMRVV